MFDSAPAGRSPPVTVLRQTDREAKTSTRRIPPHRAGPTAELSNELQAKDYEASSPSSNEEES